jgi:hypothetical protein
MERLMMPKLIDCWGNENFEDNVTSAIIACYESKVKKNKGAPPSDRMSDERLKLFRAVGPYIPSNSRFVVESDEKRGFFDIQNDQLPGYGCLSFPINGQMMAGDQHKYKGYFYNCYFSKAPALGKYWNRQGSGQIYMMLIIVMTNDGRVDGERRFFTVDKKGDIMACVQRISNVRGYMPGVKQEILTTDQHILDETTTGASYAMQFTADKKYSWVISATDGRAKVHLGCMQEEVKSLLYARNLPMSETGRKRPILHLVAAHKRRMKNGTDVDVSQFLRGQQKVEINGTKFMVHPPLAMHENLPASGRYFAA